MAKSTLIFCLLLFILDPYPGSRLVALIAVGGVMLINRLRLKYIPAEGEVHADGGGEEGGGGMGQQKQQNSVHEKKSE